MEGPRAVPIFRAVVNEKGQLTPKEVGRWAGYLARLRGKHVEVTVRPERKRRSLNQNSWYWVAIVPAVQEFLSEGRAFPLSEDQTHTILKSAFIGVEDTALGPVACESKTLTTEQFSTYCEQIRAHAASEWGLLIPGPDECAA